MYRLSPRQLQRFAGLICGSEGDDALVSYRTGVEIDQFIGFTGVEVQPREAGTRFDRVCAFLEAAQAEEDAGTSGLPRNTEKVLVALLDLREFNSTAARAAALGEVNSILEGLPARLVENRDRTVRVVSTVTTQAERVLNERIHTVFGTTLADSALSPARVHYQKAKRYLDRTNPDLRECVEGSGGQS